MYLNVLNGFKTDQIILHPQLVSMEIHLKEAKGSAPQWGGLFCGPCLFRREFVASAMGPESCICTQCPLLVG